MLGIFVVCFEAGSHAAEADPEPQCWDAGLRHHTDCGLCLECPQEIKSYSQNSIPGGSGSSKGQKIVRSLGCTLKWDNVCD